VRGIAALAVAIPHYLMSRPSNIGSDLAEYIAIISVEVFFTLSGFVLARQILLCLERGDFATISIFYIRRAIRTIPPYLLVLIAVSFLTSNLFTIDFFKYAFFVRNLFSVNDVNDYFAVSWSMAVEEWFYVVFPASMIVLHKIFRSPIRSVLIFIGFFILLKLVLMVVATEYFDHVRRIAGLRLDAIAFGFLLYNLLALRATRLGNVAGIGILVGTVILAFLLVQSLSAIYMDSRPDLNMVFVSAAPVFGCGVLVTALHWQGFVESRPIIRLPCLYLGRLSYVIYLAHTPLIILMKDTLALDIRIGMPLYVVVLLAVCWGFCEYVEKPLLAMRPNYSPAEKR